MSDHFAEEFFTERTALRPLAVDFVGREQCRPGHSWQGIRDHYLIHFVRTGRGRVLAPGGGAEPAAGDAFVLFPGIPYRYSADVDEPWLYRWIGFGGSEAGSVCHLIGAAPRPIEVPCGSS